MNLKLCLNLSGTITMLWVPLITQTEARNHKARFKNGVKWGGACPGQFFDNR